MPARSLSVLVVDSYPDAADSTAQLLALCGHHAHVAHGVQDALAALDELRPDVVVLDIPLKDGDGYDLLRRMDVALGYRPLVVVVTALANSEERSRREGIHRHLIKSVHPRVLTGLLDEYAAGRG